MNTFKIFVFLFLMVPRPSASQGIVVVVNKENPVANLSKLDLQRIYLGERTAWSNGTSIRIVDWKSGEAVKSQFYSTVMNMNPSFVKRKWLEKVILGSIQPPEVVKDEKELIEYVATHKDAIGYLASSARTGSDVKVILIDSVRILNANFIEQ